MHMLCDASPFCRIASPTNWMCVVSVEAVDFVTKSFMQERLTVQANDHSIMTAFLLLTHIPCVQSTVFKFSSQVNWGLSVYIQATTNYQHPLHLSAYKLPSRPMCEGVTAAACVSSLFTQVKPLITSTHCTCQHTSYQIGQCVRALPPRPASVACLHK